MLVTYNMTANNQIFVARTLTEVKENPSAWALHKFSKLKGGSNKYPGGIGTLPMCTAFEPREPREEEEGIWGRFQPDPADIADFKNVALFPARGEMPGCVAIGERDVGDKEIVARLKVLVPGVNLTIPIGTNPIMGNPMDLVQRVPCTWNSGVPDGYVAVDGVAVAIWERKGENLATAAAQCVAYSEQVANYLLQLGLAPDKIVVPTICYNGNLIQFGATFMLPPSFSVHGPVSRVIDLAVVENHARVAAIFVKVGQQITRLRTALQTPGIIPKAVQPPLRLRASKEFEKETDPYYVKWLDNETVAKGFGLLDLLQYNKKLPKNPSPTEMLDMAAAILDMAVANGIAHMFRVFNQLYDSPARPYVTFPVATFSRGANLHVNGMNVSDLPAGIVFPNLYRDGYRMGVPLDPSELAAFLQALGGAVEAIGKAGVVHFDLYPCNVFYRVKPGSSPLEVEIKIIDWDVSHLVGEGSIPKKMRERANDRWIKGALKNNNGIISPDYDLHYLELYNKLTSADESIRIDLASDDVNTIKRGFKMHVDYVESIEAGVSAISLHGENPKEDEDKEEEEEEDEDEDEDVEEDEEEEE